MFYDRLKYVALVAFLAVGLAGVGIGHWASAANGDRDGRKVLSDKAGPRVAQEKDAGVPQTVPPGTDEAKPNEVRPAAPGRRREAVIRLPAGTFTKEVDVAPYGGGRLTWTYEDDRVLGLIEVSAMGGEIELATEAEISMSSNGTIYGLITSVRLNHLRLPDGEEFAELKPFAGLWTAVEPLVNEVLIDLPFSYQFRVQGDRLIIHNFRILMAGPNPLGKLGGFAMGKEVGGILACFQALGVAMEGTYTAADAQEKAPPKKRPMLPKHGGRVGAKTITWPRDLLPHKPYTPPVRIGNVGGTPVYMSPAGQANAAYGLPAVPAVTGSTTPVDPPLHSETPEPPIRSRTPRK